jgi:hypothetical protein
VAESCKTDPAHESSRSPSSLNERLTLLEVWDVELVWPVAGTCQRHQKEQQFNGSRYPWEQCQSTPPHPPQLDYSEYVRSRTGVGVGVLLVADSQPVHLGIRPPFGTLDKMLSCSSFSSDNYLILRSKASSLTRKRVCSSQCNHCAIRSLKPNHTLPSHLRLCSLLSPLTTRRDCGGSILTRLHTG